MSPKRDLQRGLSRRRGLALGGFALLLSLVLTVQAWGVQDDLELTSRVTGGAAASDASDIPSSSADGRFIAFQSAADNLSSEDDNSLVNVFLRDTQDGTTTLISRADGAAGAAADADSVEPTVSDDGRFVAFESGASNLSSADVTFFDIFLRDTLTNTTTLVSRATGVAGAGADDRSFDPSISTDGSVIAFESDATNLGDDIGGRDIFVRDTSNATTTFVSRATGHGGAASDGNSGEARVSSDGRFVAFQSGSTNISTEDDDTVFDIYVRDLVAGTTTFASRATGLLGTPGDQSSLNPTISADGRFVGFRSNASTLSSEEDESVINVFVRDTQSGTTTLASRATGAAGTVADGDSDGASISDDGGSIAFFSSADTLSPDDVAAVDDVFVRDIQADTTTLVSRATGAAGAAGDDNSTSPSISGDARFVAFASDADNLSGIANDVTNVFQRQIALDPPVNLEAPVLDGAPTRGQALACSEGEWTDGTISRQWRRGGTAIGGATGASYTAADADIGELVDCIVTATNAAGSASEATNKALIADGETLFAVLFNNKLKGKAGKKKTVRFASSNAGEAELVATRKNTEISATSTLDQAGAHKLKLKLFKTISKSAKATAAKRKPIKKGTYALTLTVIGSDGQTAIDNGKLKVKKKR